MSFGSIPKLPNAIPNISAQPAYSIPAGEDRLLQFDDIDLWVQPDLGNARRAGDNLSVMGRKGQIARSRAPGITVGAGMENGVEVINMPGGFISTPQLPLGVDGYRIEGSYFVAMLFRWDANVVLAGTVYQLLNSGIEGGDDVEIYMLNNALYVRHGDAQNATTGSKFAAGQSYLVWVSYDAVTDKAVYGINSANAGAWQAENLTGAPATTRDMVIGGKLNPAGNGATQMMHGQVRAVWAGRTQWATDDKAAVRDAFIAQVAALYPDDITLV